MTHFSTERFNLRARPWLVLWLLPYLVLSVVAAGHNHGFGESHHAPVAALAAQSESHSEAHVASVGSVVTETALAASHAAHDAFCLACQWTNWAAATFVGAPSLFVSIAATMAFLALHFAPTRRTLTRAAVRGPPSH